MTTDQLKRKLAAILNADVKGYSRLMGEDEEGTIRTLKTYLEVITGLIQQHRGRIIATGGDSVLAEFGSVVDAVRCAVEIQKELQNWNKTVAEDRRLEFRIGVNLGDVVEEGDTILGDGVNIAARLEGLSEAGGICISGTAFDQVRNKLDLGYEYLGEQTVKNIALPVRAYKVLMEPDAVGKVIGEKKPKPEKWGWKAIAGVAVMVLVAGGLVWNFYLRGPQTERARVEKMAFPLPDKPSIAVLPFVNISGDPQQEYFSDGLTEDIITALSKVQRLFVIARNSTFTYKRKPVKVQQVAEELGVQYVLEGSVQRAGDRVRITAQLIDALKGHHLWVERYDRGLKDLFALQDEITMKILMALQVKLVEGEQALVRARGTNNFEAYEKFLQATEQHYLFTREAGVRARQLCEEAIALDPQYAAAYGLLSVALLAEVRHRWTRSPPETMRQALEMAQKALALDPTTLIGQLAMGQIHMLKREHDEAIAWGERAVSTYPNADNAHAFLAWFLTMAGRPEEAVPLLKKAIRRNPMPPGWYFVILGASYRLIGRFDEAISELKKAVAYSPNELMAHVTLAGAYAEAGRLEEARAEAAEVLRISPTFSIENQARVTPYKNQDHSNRLVEALRKAGLK